LLSINCKKAILTRFNYISVISERFTCIITFGFKLILGNFKKAKPGLALFGIYSYNIETMLTGCITAWYGNCTALDHKVLQRVVRTAQYIRRCQRKA
jgi:hypothetical protein